MSDPARRSDPEGRKAGPGLLRPDDGEAARRVTFVEVFFDVVFIFAFTQLTQLFVEEESAVVLVETIVLTAAIWWIWVDTAWVSNWLNPEKWPVRGLFLVLMGLGLTLSSAVPHAFAERGWVFGVGVAAIELIRTIFAMLALQRRRPDNARHFTRVLAWTVCSSALWLAGGFGPEELRLWFWLGALAVEFLGPLLFFWTPRLGRTPAETWDVTGEHMAERVGLFFIIAIGESIIVTGTVFAGVELSPAAVAGYAAAFVSSVLLWMLYFNHGERGGRVAMDRARETALVARTAYTFIPVIMVVGVVITAIADELVIVHPFAGGEHDVRWTWVLACVGPAIYLIGNTFFKRAVGMPWLISHLAAIVVLVGVSAVPPFASPVALSWAVNAVLAGVVVADEWNYRRAERTGR